MMHLVDRLVQWYASLELESRLESNRVYARAVSHFGYSLMGNIWEEHIWYRRAHARGQFDGPTYRRKLSEMYCYHTAHMFDQACSDMNIRIQRGPTVDVKGPCVIVCTHRSTFDVLFMFNELRELHQNHMRCVVKEAVREDWILRQLIGNLAIDSGCAFVKRESDVAKDGSIDYTNAHQRRQQNLAELNYKAALARQEGASFFLFPEGTRFNGRPSKGYKHLLQPKKGGYQTIRKHYQGLPTVAIAHRIIGGDHARTFDSLAGLRNTTIVTSQRLIPAEEADHDLALDHIWRQNDELLAA